MNDKIESPAAESHDQGGAGKKPSRPAQPSFEDVLSGRASEPPKPAPAPARKETPPPPRPPAQPSFEDILKAAPAPGAQAAEASQKGTDEGQREKSARPPRREQRKAVVVMRKPALGQPLPPPVTVPLAQGKAPSADAAPEAAEGEQGGQEESAGETASAGQPAQAERPRRERGNKPPRQQQPQREPAPLRESVYATPTDEENQDFAALLAQANTAQSRPARLKVGQKISARIAHLGGEVAFLDLGGKGEGVIDLGELRDQKGELEHNIGDSIEGYVLSLGGPDAGVVITRQIPKGAGKEHLHAAMEGRIPVEGVVTAQNKGGLEVDLGGLRAFVPASQVDVRFVEDQGVFVGQKLRFLVMEMRGGNAVLSRRALLEEERKGAAQELRRRLEVGATLEGEVTSVRDFGAFVDLGGLEGLIHVSELSHQRVAHAQDVVKQGQKVRVQVLRIDPPEKAEPGKKEHGERIALSLRALEQDPWDAAQDKLEEGQKLQGKVVRLQPFGAFVELFPGVDGLVHVSALANKHVNHPREVVQEGEQIWVQIESVDREQKRVSLRRITEEEAQSEGPVAPRERPGRGGREPREGSAREGGQAAPQKRSKVGDVLEVTVDRCEPFGVFVKWADGRGLVPNPELGTPRGSDNKKVMPVGTVFKAQVIEIDQQGRYRLSKTGAEHAQERAEMDEYHRSVKKPAGKGFGTLGDLLRAKLGK